MQFDKLGKLAMPGIWLSPDNNPDKPRAARILREIDADRVEISVGGKTTTVCLRDEERCAWVVSNDQPTENETETSKEIGELPQSLREMSPSSRWQPRGGEAGPYFPTS